MAGCGLMAVPRMGKVPDMTEDDLDVLPYLDPDDGRVCWFGTSWHAPVNESARQVDVPVGAHCAGTNCDRTFDDKDSGFTLIHAGREKVGPSTQPVGGRIAYHRECFLREVLGPAYKDLFTGHNAEVDLTSGINLAELPSADALR